MKKPRQQRPSFVDCRAESATFSSWVVCIVSLGVLSLPGCSGCRSKAVEDAVKQHTRRQQQERPTSEETPPRRSSTDAAAPAESPATSAAGRPPASKAPASPSAAASQAKSLYRQGRRKSEAGDAAGAFQDASAAWNLVRRFPNDPECKRIEEEIAGRLDQLAKNANRKHGGTSGTEGKTLIEE